MNTPPKWLTYILQNCCPKDRIDVLGDFEEWYHELLEEKGAFRANVIFLLHGISMLKLKITTRSKSKTQTNMTSLHFKLAKRNLTRNKLYSGINIVGLTVGLAICVLIGLFIQDELSYDKHFKNYERVYRVAGEYDQGGDTKTFSTLTPYLLKGLMENNFDAGIKYSQMDFTQSYVSLEERGFWVDYAVAVDSNFFEVFETEFIAGNPETALDDPFGVVLDYTTATKLFGGEESMGKSFEIEGRTYTLNGIIKDLPDNTHFIANMFFPIASIKDTYPQWMTQTYGGISHRTYFKVPEQFDIDLMEASLNELVASYTKGDQSKIYFFQQLQDIHLKSDLSYELRVNGSYQTLYIFLATAIIIILLASINFINLSVAGSLRRLREIGVKKVFGASRQSQITQFQTESIIIGFISSVLAVFVVELLLPIFNEVTGKELTISYFQDFLIFLSCLGLVFVIAFIAGSFPAHFLLKVPLSRALAGMLNSKGTGSVSRNILVGIQFFLATILIASTLVIMRQLNFMQDKDLGVETEQLIMVPLQSYEGYQNYSLVQNELLSQPSVLNVTSSSAALTNRVGGWRQYRKTEGQDAISIPTVVIAHDYFETIGAEMIDGRSFDKEFSSDYLEAYIINETAADFLDYENPVGERLIGSAFTGSSWSTKDAKIIGVVKDFHFASLHEKIRPVAFSLSSEVTIPMNWMLVKVKPEDIEGTLAIIQDTWRSINPSTPFRYEFVDETIQEHYQQEARFLEIFSAFSMISIMIGCLGLFGLTAFVMKRRTKEIGIRKVLGANQLILLRVLSKDFIKLVLISSIPGIPVTIWLMTRWLESFEYRVTIGWWAFALTILGALIAAGISIVYHSLKVSNANPVDSIKWE